MRPPDRTGPPPGGPHRPPPPEGLPPLDFTYRCSHCTRTSEFTEGAPKAGLCDSCSETLVSPETLAAIGRICSENPPGRHG